ncbi:MAG: hypothetical protein IJ146_06995 [Kiritimatiellae bacterium]|nr:hypothetical protein [Kiritimatiellia bacterium]
MENLLFWNLSNMLSKLHPTGKVAFWESAFGNVAIVASIQFQWPMTNWGLELDIDNSLWHSDIMAL